MTGCILSKEGEKKREEKQIIKNTLVFQTAVSKPAINDKLSDKNKTEYFISTQLVNMKEKQKCCQQSVVFL